MNAPVEQVDTDAANALDDALGFLTDIERPIVVQAFAAARLAERERCAKVADAQATLDRTKVHELTGPNADPNDERSHYLWAQQTAESIATAIRSPAHVG